MADDQYRWNGQSTGTVGADYAAASNWIDITTGADPSPTVPGAGDAISFSAVPTSGNIVSLTTNETAGDMSVVNGSTIDLLGAAAIPFNSFTAVQTLTVQSLSVGVGGSSDSGGVFTYNTEVNDLGTLTLNNGLLSSQPTAPGGIVVGDASYTPHGDVHVGTGGTIVSTGASSIYELSDDGLVRVATGTLRLVNPASDGGGVSGFGTIDVAGGTTLDVSGATYYNNIGINNIGTLHLEQGGVLNLGSDDLQITGDFINNNAGTGNSYNPLANVVFQHNPIGPPIGPSGRTPDLGGFLSGDGGNIAVGGAAVSGSGTTYTLDLGSYHVGDTLDAGYTIQNSGTPGDNSVRGAIQTAANGATISDAGLSGSGVTAQNFGPIAAGGTSDPYQVTLSADQAGQSTLATLALPSDLGNMATLDITGTGYNYAMPVFETVSGGGTLTHCGNAWTLDLGTLAANSSAGTVDIAAANAASGLSDSLSGSYDVSGSGFNVTGTSSFSGIAAGGMAPSIAITPDTMQSGTHTETILLHPTGSNPSGYSAPLADQTLTVTDTVASGGNGGGTCPSLSPLLSQLEKNLYDLLGNLPHDLGKTLLADLGKLEGAFGGCATPPQTPNMPWLHSS